MKRPYGTGDGKQGQVSEAAAHMEGQEPWEVVHARGLTSASGQACGVDVL